MVREIKTAILPGVIRSKNEATRLKSEKTAIYSQAPLSNSAISRGFYYCNKAFNNEGK